jgi:probable HAF family extracellular repeat protein
MEVKKRFFASSVALILVFGLYATAAWAETKSCVAAHYKVSRVPLRPADINQSGEIAGTISGHKAALWSQQHWLQEIELLPGYTSGEGVALNSAGQLVGIAVDLRTNRRQGFTYKDGKLLALSSGARPLAINNAGIIVGEARTSSNAMSGPALWDNLVPISLGGCCGGTAVAINQKGQIVGKTYDQQGHYHAFLKDKGGDLRPIGPASDFSSALLLNDAGDYLLQSFPGGLVFYHEGKPSHLTLAPKAPSHPRAMNSCPVIVGSFGIFPDYYRAFAWDLNRGFQDLNSLIPPDSGWKLQEATSINEHGDIVGWGELHGEESVGFLLTPLP